MNQRQNMKLGGELILLAILLCSIFWCIGRTEVDAISNKTVKGQMTNHEIGILSPNNISSQGYDVIFVVDNSRSIWSSQDIRDEALHTVVNLAMGSDIRFGAVYFARDIYKTCALTSVKSEEGYEKVINEILTFEERDAHNRDTNIGIGLKEALTLLDKQNMNRIPVIILLSDGVNENFDEDANFKKQADQMTKTQVLEIQRKNIDFYCAFITKDHSNEAYMRRLVNFFGDTHEYDDHFVSVSRDNLEELSNRLANVFYRFNGNMDYANMEGLLDSDGNYTFYIPDLSVSKLQVYIHTQDKAKVTLKDSSGSSDAVEQFQEGNNYFLNVENPKSGDWLLHVEGTDVKKISGTVAYYSNLRINASVDGELYKKSKISLRCEIMDLNGNAIEKLDPAMKATATVSIVSDDEKLQQEALKMRIDGKMLISNEFTIQKTGKMYIDLDIKYNDYIALHYKILEGQEVSVIAPKISDYFGGLFGVIRSSSIKDKQDVTEDSDKKVYFTLPLKDYVEDPDSDLDKYQVKQVDVLDLDNKVSASCQDGCLVVRAEKFSTINCYITLLDDDGMEGTINIKGILIKSKVIYSLLIILILLLLSPIVLFLRKLWIRNDLEKRIHMKEQMLRKEKEILWSDVSRLERNLEETEFVTIAGVYKKIEEYLQYEYIDPFVLEILFSKKFANTKSFFDVYEKSIAIKMEFKDIVDEIEKNLDLYREREGFPLNELQKIFDSYGTLEDKIKQKNVSLKSDLVDTQRQIECIVSESQYMSNDFSRLLKLSKLRFRDNIIMDVGTARGIYLGRSDVTNWYYKVNDVSIVNQGKVMTLEEFVGKSTEMLFLPNYVDIGSDEAKSVGGIRLMARTPFCLRENKNTESFIETQNAILKRGSYRIDSAEIGSIFITVK